MRAGEFSLRLIGAALVGLALAVPAPGKAAHGSMNFDQPQSQPEPAAPASLEWFNPKHPEPAAAWTPIERTDWSGTRLVLLVHGLDEPGGVWDDLAPALAAQGHAAVRFEYPNDQAIALSAGQLAQALAELRERGVQELWIVAHSMGGLVTLDALTRKGFDHARWPEVRRVITLGTPMGGSVLAPVRLAAEWREHAVRALADGEIDRSDLARTSSDGSGRAGRDLTPGSAFLTELHARPRPEGPPITAVVAELPEVDARGVESLLLSGLPAPLQHDPDARQAAKDFGTWASKWYGEAAQLIGDGVVDQDSARSAWTADVVPVRALHRSMITRVPCPVRGDADPPAIAIVLDRIRSDQAEENR